MRLLLLSAIMIPAAAAAQTPTPNQPAIRAPAPYVPQQALAFGERGQAAASVTNQRPLPVHDQGSAVSYQDRSAATAQGGVAQGLAPANPARHGFFVQNLSGDDLWLGLDGTAGAGRPSIRVGPGQLYESPRHGAPAGAISILGTAAGQSFTAKEW